MTISHEMITSLSIQQFKITPCHFQREICIALLRKIDTIATAPTGFSKTITFFLPKLFECQGITIIICPLNTLRIQHTQKAREYGFHSLAVSQESFGPLKHQVCVLLYHLFYLTNIPRKFWLVTIVCLSLALSSFWTDGSLTCGSMTSSLVW